MPSILNNLNLLKKYDLYAFDYIEYPHKSFWIENKFNTTDYKTACEEFASGKFFKNINLQKNNKFMLYVHIPFCHELCSFCICHREITSKYQRASDYLYKSLVKEIDVVSKIVNNTSEGNLEVGELYFGGGSPTYLNERDFSFLLSKLKNSFRFSNEIDINVEIDPRRIEIDRLYFYHAQGVNKLSFGIQDFDKKVQIAINRIQPAELTEKLLTQDIRDKFKAVNFDLLVGLPEQTNESLKNTVTKVCEMSPDRVSLAYLHYGPKYHVHQRLMLKDGLLPDFYERKELFEEAVNILIGNGYVRTGFEHFALPTDDVAKAAKKKTALYNSLGSTSGDVGNIITVGKSAYSTIGKYYFQAPYDQEKYSSALDKGEIPIFRGFKLSEDDFIRREIIKSIRTFFEYDFSNLELHNSYKEIFSNEFENLKEFEDDGLINIKNKKIILTENGKHFSNLIGSVFDKYVKRKPFRTNIPVLVA